MKPADTIIRHAKQLVTPSGAAPALGDALRRITVIPDGAIAIKEGMILTIGTDAEVMPFQGPQTRMIDASEYIVLPGFVDCHTHAIFAGTREHEFVRKIEGASYLDILKGGGGILNTVRTTRAADEESLTRIGMDYLNRMTAYGTTTVEIKSGYGLTVEDERKLLRVVDGLRKAHTVDIVSTFLGAHALPPEMDRARYVDLVVEEMLPACASLATFCDVFCEDGAFTVRESERILRKGLDYGLIPKIHAGEFNPLGGARLAAELDAASADHLDAVTEDEVDAMAAHGTAAVFLPPVNFYLRSERYPDARRFIERGVPVAIATDFNPGSAPTWSMPFTLSLACLYLRMSPAEALTAATLNAACAIRMQDRVGSLEPGKQADIILLRVPSFEAIPYFFAVNPVEMVIKRGETVVDAR